MSTITIPEGLVLFAGAHHEESGQGCILEWVSRLAGEPWSDHPSCTAPVLRAYVIRIHDAMPDEIRQRLIPVIPRLIGTAPEPEAIAQRRAYLCADRAARVFAPLALEAAGLRDEATRLRAVSPVVDRVSAAAAASAATWAALASASAATWAAVASAASAASADEAAASAAVASAASAASADEAAASAAAAAAAAAAWWAARSASSAQAWDEALVLLDDLLAVMEADVADDDPAWKGVEGE